MNPFPPICRAHFLTRKRRDGSLDGLPVEEGYFHVVMINDFFPGCSTGFMLP